ncbi:MAG: dihydrofolate reductase [Chitinophagales bacterium]|nr:dihydrofolate reductase [Chitinophagales bacterium]
MRKLILYSAVSLDNYIARPNGKVDWLEDPDYVKPKEDYGYHKFYETIDTTLMGNGTYKILEDFDVPFPYPDKTNYVFSRSKENEDTEFIKYIYGDIIGFTQQLKETAGKDIWLIGGGQINSELLNHDLIDRIILTTFPIVLGKGIPLFNGEVKESKFELVESQHFDYGLLQLTFDKKQ